MSIENHKWSELNIKSAKEFHGAIQVKLNYEESHDVYFEENLYINKLDSLAIAKHFNQDRESLEVKIKALIALYEFGEEHIGERSYNLVKELNKLLTDNLTAEVVE